MPVLAPLEVTAPPVSPYRFGLLSAATVVPFEDRHLGLGHTWLPEQCERPGIAPDPCLPVVDKEFKPQPAPVEGQSFVVYGSWECMLPGFTPQEGRDGAVRHLTQGEQRAVEYAVWTGAGNARPYLIHPDTTTLPAATEPAAAVAALEDFLAGNQPGVGVIHAPRGAAAWLARDNQIRYVADRAETSVGTRYAFGAGYSEANAAPLANEGDPLVAAPAGSYWLYATSSVLLRRGELLAPGDAVDGFNFTTNLHRGLAERFWAPAWDCPVAAVLLTP